MLALDILQPHPTWGIIDSSKLHAYMACPRRYFYEYILGWRPSYPNNHLVFGTAWHIATEHLAREGFTQTALEEASFLFLAHYRQEFSPQTDSDYAPKSPENALRSLAAYAQKFRQDLYDYTLEHTEIAGVVMVGEDMEMHFKLDWIGRDTSSGKYLFIDQKTSQRKLSNWGSQWQLSTQMLLYTHALNCLYGRENVSRSKIRCTFFYKAQPTSFEEAEIVKSGEQMDAFLTRTQQWYSSLSTDMLMLSEEKSNEVAMLAFPQNENACFSYGTRCSYFDFCNSFSNPLELVRRGVPIGFKEEWWNPSAAPEIRERVPSVLAEGVI